MILSVRALVPQTGVNRSSALVRVSRSECSPRCATDSGLLWLRKQLCWWIGRLIDRFVYNNLKGSDSKIEEHTLQFGNRCLAKYIIASRREFSKEPFISVGVDAGRVGKKNLWVGFIGCSRNVAAVIPPTDRIRPLSVGILPDLGQIPPLFWAESSPSSGGFRLVGVPVFGLFSTFPPFGRRTPARNPAESLADSGADFPDSGHLGAGIRPGFRSDLWPSAFSSTLARCLQPALVEIAPTGSRTP